MFFYKIFFSILKSIKDITILSKMRNIHVNWFQKFFGHPLIINKIIFIFSLTVVKLSGYFMMCYV